MRDPFDPTPDSEYLDDALKEIETLKQKIEKLKSQLAKAIDAIPWDSDWYDEPEEE